MRIIPTLIQSISNGGFNRYKLNLKFSEASDNCYPGTMIELYYYGARLGSPIEGFRIDFIIDLIERITRADEINTLSMLLRPFKKSKNIAILVSRFIELYHNIKNTCKFIFKYSDSIGEHFPFEESLKREIIPMKINNIDSSDDKCITCCDEKVSIMFSPCNHKCLCFECSQKLESRTCPLCRKNINCDVNFEEKEEAEAADELFLQEALERDEIEKSSKIYGGSVKISLFFFTKKIEGGH